MNLIIFQEFLNEDTEEKLIGGLQKAAKQILQEHGYRQVTSDDDEEDQIISDDEVELDREGEWKEDAPNERDEKEEEDEDEDDEEEGDIKEEEHDDDDQKLQHANDHDIDSEGEESDSDFVGKDSQMEIMEDDFDDEIPPRSHDVGHHIERKRQVQGLLRDYLESSPQAVELQTIWKLEIRQSSRRVADKHTFLLAVILRCLRGTEGKAYEVGQNLCYRLVNDHANDLHDQLVSNNQALAASTLHLLRGLTRFSPGSAREVISRFSLTSKPVLHLFVPSSFSRPVGIALVSAFLRCRDPAVVVRILCTDRIMSSVFKSLLTDGPRSVLNWVLALSKALRHPWVPAKIKRRLITSTRLEQLRRLFQQRATGASISGGAIEIRKEAVRRLFHLLLLAGDEGKKGIIKIKGPRGMNTLIRLLLALSASDDMMQRQLSLKVLVQHHKMAAPFMRRLHQTWDAKPSFSALMSYAFLTKLLYSCPLPSFKSNARCNDSSASLAGEEALADILPSGLGKRELTKFILNPNPLIQRMGLLLIVSMLDRTDRAITTMSIKKWSASRKFRVALNHRLPDLQAVLALRSRCCPQQGIPQPAWGHHLYALLLQVLRRYQEVLPEAIRVVRFDFLRLVGDYHVLSLPVFAQWELLRLLSLLGPGRLQWLPPDLQAWNCPQSPRPVTAFGHLLNLLQSTQDIRIYKITKDLIVSIIKHSTEAPAELLLSCLDGDSESSCILEFALRLTSTRPYAFSLVAMKVLSQSEHHNPITGSNGSLPPPLIVALILLGTTLAKDAEDASLFRIDLRDFGLAVDWLWGRYASSPGAVRYIRTVIRCMRLESDRSSGSVLDACVGTFLVKDSSVIVNRTFHTSANDFANQEAQVRRIKECLASLDDSADTLCKLEGMLWNVSPEIIKTNDNDTFNALFLKLLSRGGVGKLCLANYLGRYPQPSIFSLVHASSSGRRTGGIKEVGGISSLLPSLPLSVLLDHAEAVANDKGPFFIEVMNLLIQCTDRMHSLKQVEAACVICQGRLDAALRLREEGKDHGWLLQLMAVASIRQGMKISYSKESTMGKEICFDRPSMAGTQMKLWLGIVALARTVDTASASSVALRGDDFKEPEMKQALGWGLVLGGGLDFTERSSLVELCCCALKGVGKHACGVLRAIVRDLLEGLLAENQLSKETKTALCELFLEMDLTSQTVFGRTFGKALLKLATGGVVAILAKHLSRLMDWCWMSIIDSQDIDKQVREDLVVPSAFLIAQCVQESEVCRGLMLGKLKAYFARERPRGRRKKEHVETDKACAIQCLLLLGPLVAVLGSRIADIHMEEKSYDFIMCFVELLFDGMTRSLENGSITDILPTKTEARLESWCLIALKRMLALGARNVLLSKHWNGSFLGVCEKLQEQKKGHVSSSIIPRLLQTCLAWLLCPDRDFTPLQKFGAITAFLTGSCYQYLMSIDPAHEQIYDASGSWLACIRETCTRHSLARPSAGADVSHDTLIEYLHKIALLAADRLLDDSLVSTALVILDFMLLLASQDEGEGNDGQSFLRSILDCMIRSSQLPQALQAHRPVKERMNVLGFMVYLFSRAGTLEHGRCFLPVLLSSYQGSPSGVDRFILRLVYLCHEKGLPFGLHWLRVGVRAEDLDQAMNGAMNKLTSWTLNDSWLTEWIRLERIYTSLERFPLHHALYPPRTRWEEHGDSEKFAEERDEENEVPATPGYDPSFILPLMEGMLKHDQLSFRGLIDSGLIAFCLLSLASEHKDVRTCAYSALGRIFNFLITASKSDPGARERPQQLLLLNVVRGSAKEPYVRFAYCHALFFARAAIIMSKPANDLYVSLNTFLVCRQALNLEEVPLFFPLFYSARAFHRRERVWMLRLMKDSLRSADDFALMKRQHCFSLVLSSIDGISSAYKASSDMILVNLALEVLSSAIKLPEGAYHLLSEVGVLAWAQGAIISLLDQQSIKTFGPTGRRKSVALLISILNLILGLLEAVSKVQGGNSDIADHCRSLSPILHLLVSAVVSPGLDHSPIQQRQAIFSLVIELLACIDPFMVNTTLSTKHALSLIQAFESVMVCLPTDRQERKQLIKRGRHTLWDLLTSSKGLLMRSGTEEIGEGSKSEEAMREVLIWIGRTVVSNFLHDDTADHHSMADLSAAGRFTLQVLLRDPCMVGKLAESSLFWSTLLLQIWSREKLLPGADLCDLHMNGSSMRAIQAKAIACWSAVTLKLFLSKEAAAADVVDDDHRRTLAQEASRYLTQAFHMDEEHDTMREKEGKGENALGQGRGETGARFVVADIVGSVSRFLVTTTKAMSSPDLEIYQRLYGQIISSVKGIEVEASITVPSKRASDSPPSQYARPKNKPKTKTKRG